MEIICFDNHNEVITYQSKDYVMQNVIVNGVAWKLDQSDVTLIVEHSKNLKPKSNI